MLGKLKSNKIIITNININKIKIKIKTIHKNAKGKKIFAPNSSNPLRNPKSLVFPPKLIVV